MKIINFISVKKKRNIINKRYIREKKYEILFLFFNLSFKIYSYIYIYKQINQTNNFRKFRNLNKNLCNLKIYIFQFKIYLIEI